MKSIKWILLLAVAALAAYMIAFPDKWRGWFGLSTSTGTSTGTGAGTVAVVGGSTAVNSSTPISGTNTYASSFADKANVVKDINGFPLVQGDTGDKVKVLQAALNRNWGSALVVDGIFGPKTYKAISANGFNADALSLKEYYQITG